MLGPWKMESYDSYEFQDGMSFSRYFMLWLQGTGTCLLSCIREFNRPRVPTTIFSASNQQGLLKGGVVKGIPSRFFHQISHCQEFVITLKKHLFSFGYSYNMILFIRRAWWCFLTMKGGNELMYSADTLIVNGSYLFVYQKPAFNTALG